MPEGKQHRHVEAERRLASDDEGTVAATLALLAMNDPDWPWVQRRAEGLASHSAVRVRQAVATALGTLAMIHGQLDMATAAPILLRLSRDPEVAVEAADAIEQVETGTGLSVSEA